MDWLGPEAQDSREAAGGESQSGKWAVKAGVKALRRIANSGRIDERMAFVICSSNDGARDQMTLREA